MSSAVSASSGGEGGDRGDGTGAAVAGTGGGWGRRFVRLFARLRDRLRVVFARLFSRERNVVAYATRAEAINAAEQRRIDLRAAMAAGELTFHEVPPAVRRSPASSTHWEPESQSMAALGMRWQLDNMDVALLARVTDYVRAITADVRDLARPSVVLERIPRPFERLDPFLHPWRVVVWTPAPRLVRKRIRAAGLQPGIGIDVARVVAPTPQRGSCRRGDGRTGMAPGRLRDAAGVTYALTCAHVVDATCECAAFGPEHIGQPGVSTDAVMLRKDSCFKGSKGDFRPLTAASPDEWSRLGRKPPMLRLGETAGNRHGLLRGPMTGFFHEDGWCDMPALAIQPRTWRYGVMPWPLFRRGFSREGDSGDWVVGGDGSETWMGMIAQGSPTLSIAIQAPALLEFCDQELVDTTGTPRVVTDDCFYAT